MAKFSFEIPDDLIQKLERLKTIDKVAPMMLKAGSFIVYDEITARAYDHYETGDMLDSIQPTEPTRKESKYSAVVRPTGRDRNGLRNMEKMAYLEYGTSHQPSTPVITPAVIACEDQVIETMTDVFEKSLFIGSAKS